MKMFNWLRRKKLETIEDLDAIHQQVIDTDNELSALVIKMLRPEPGANNSAEFLDTYEKLNNLRKEELRIALSLEKQGLIQIQRE